MLSSLVALTLAACTSSTEFDDWTKTGLEPPCRLSLARQKPAAALATVQRTWKLTPEQAECALGPARSTSFFEQQKAWLDCAQRFPGVPLFSFGALTHWNGELDLATIVAQLTLEQVDRALALHNPPMQLLLARKLELAPEQFTSMLEKLTTNNDLDARHGLAWARLRSGVKPTSLETRYVESLLINPLVHGELTYAAQLFLELDPEVQRAFASEPQRFPLLGWEVGHRALLVVGLMNLGRKDVARTIVVLPEPVHELPDPPTDFYVDLAHWLVTGQRNVTPWNAVLRARTRYAVKHWGALRATLPYVKPFEAVLARQVSLMESDPPTTKDDLAWPVGLRAELWAARAEDRVRALEAMPRAKSSADAGVEGATLPEPLALPWVEESPVQKWVPNRVVPKSKHAVPTWNVVRVETLGTKTVALGLAQTFDPVGEVSHGAYWLFVRDAPKAEWKKRYLGLIDFRPFRALETSTVPLLDANGVVRLAMKEAPLDEQSVTFPPLFTRAPTKRPLVVLRTTLAELEKDTDGDGLTDLAEGRLLLDPRRDDTDGDGLLDGVDPTPRLDDRAPPTPTAKAYEVFFEQFLLANRRAQALVVEPGHGNPVGVQAPVQLDEVHFLVGDAKSLGSLKPPFRVITLTEAELAAARARYGAFFPMSLEVTVEGPDHAFIEWSERWRGGSLRIDRGADGKFVITELESWIS